MLDAVDEVPGAERVDTAGGDVIGVTRERVKMLEQFVDVAAVEFFHELVLGAA